MQKFPPERTPALRAATPPPDPLGERAAMDVVVPTAAECRTRSRAADASRRLAACGVDLLFPLQCLVCRRRLLRAWPAHFEQTGRRAAAQPPWVFERFGSRALGFTIQFCEECFDRLLDRRRACPRCGRPVGPYIVADDDCPSCRKRSQAYRRVSRLGVYDGVLRQVCIRAKSPNGGPAAASLALALFLHQRQRLESPGYDAVVAVPTHWIKTLTGHHNAAYTIATVLARCLDLPLLEKALIKHRRTPDQSELPGKLRRRNLIGAFRVSDAQAVRNKRLLLVDDILTTGATATETSRTLRRAGARAVDVAVIAIVEGTR
ncbi:MAG: ComF family protein [Planctomycetota bacterium]|nr:MAG: ComF family protein [Planctomycetota bacterium]